MAHATVVAMRAYVEQVPDTAEQLITVSGATGGVLGLAYDGEVATVAWNATATSVAAALSALAPLVAYAEGNGDPIVTVRGRRGGPWRVRFGLALGDSAELLVADVAGLTGPAPTATVATYYDGVLQDCLDRATDMCDAVLQPIVFAAYGAAAARRIPGFGGTQLWLPPHAPGSVTAVSLGGGAVADWSYVPAAGGPTAHLYRAAGWAHTAEDRRYDAWPAASGLGAAGLGGWPAEDALWTFTAAGAYLVTAQWGYGPPPPAVEQLCLELAVNIWRGRDRGMFTETIGAEGAGAVRYIGALNKSQQAILQGVKDARWQQAI